MYDEDYFRKIIGDNYKPSDYYANSTYKPNNIGNDTNIPITRTDGNSSNMINITTTNDFKSDFDKYYPEIYRIINPMIEAVVEKNNGSPITEDLIEVMSREVYDAVEVDVDDKSERRSDKAIKVNATPIVDELESEGVAEAEINSKPIENSIESEVLGEAKINSNLNPTNSDNQTVEASTKPVSQTNYMRPPMSNKRSSMPPYRPPMGGITNPPIKPPTHNPKPPMNKPRPPHRPKNSILYDLIKILLINHIIDRHM